MRSVRSHITFFPYWEECCDASVPQFSSSDKFLSGNYRWTYRLNDLMPQTNLFDWIEQHYFLTGDNNLQANGFTVYSASRVPLQWIIRRCNMPIQWLLCRFTEDNSSPMHGFSSQYSLQEKHHFDKHLWQACCWILRAWPRTSMLWMWCKQHQQETSTRVYGKQWIWYSLFP